MELNFSDEKYREKALSASYDKYSSQHSVEDAFFLLIKDVKKEDLSNLSRLVQGYFKIKEQNIELSEEEAYKLTQGTNVEDKVILDEKNKNIIYRLAYLCIEKGIPLGNNTIMDGKINTSHWISHALFEGKLAGQLASKVGLNVEMATKLGILHDYGRKIVHNNGHIIKGYEALIDEGWDAEAIGCLTHSFLAGGRSAWNDEPEEGFFLDEEGNACCKQDAKKDDISNFLENYKYTKYDVILNISDLMATSYGIVSPAERIIDIATRRKNIDQMPNRGYFLAEFRNKLLEILEDMGSEIPEEIKYELKANSASLQKIKEEFEDTSDLFYSEYQKSFGNNQKEVNEPTIKEDGEEVDF